MASCSSSPTSVNSKSASELLALQKEIRSHEIAIAELNSISSSRAVYQRNGNLFFRTTSQKATACEQKRLEIVQAKLKTLSA